MTADKAIDHIYKYLCENQPKLKGRNYKQYSRDLKINREVIAEIVCIYRSIRKSTENITGN